jgi:hypothetical protein
MSKVKFEDPKDLKVKVDKYFEECDKKQEPYTMTGLAISLGTNRMTLLRYNKQTTSERLAPEIRQAIADIIENAKARVEAYAEKRLYAGNNCTGVIFSLKNNFLWKDQSEVVKVEVDKPDLSGLTIEELKEMMGKLN